MKCVCIADTHLLESELCVPSGDLLIHAGDFTMFGRTEGPIRRFNEWLGSLSHKYKLCVCGNHEYVLEARPDLRSKITNATVLMNEAVKIEGYTIWGSPMTIHPGGAFAVPHANERARIYATVPPETDILITHMPPHGILDKGEEGDSEGDVELLRAVARVQPRLHVFGHVHAAYGTKATAHTLFVNASMLDEFGGVDRRAIVVNLHTPRGTENIRGENTQ